MRSGPVVRERRRARRADAGDPFLALGLPRAAGLSDDDVRAAWRRIAAATHPDRDDGGDPARFGAAAAAYATLRTAFGRGEALADLAGGQDRAGGQGRPGGHDRPREGGGERGRGGRGRPGVLALRVAAAGAVCAVAFAVAGWSPACAGVLAGAVTWLVATGRHDLRAR